ncbi:TolC family protein [Brevibacillus sp. HD1.4A]|uniref:TolC family protein n=1 Tax=Brevibacillus sp. HD1.4A TaxID=2738978 RepID=UPI00156AB645|nr:TolC family protein [Brevibacillus sp. HD1.4A]NRQ56899.1 TolC family protein [Brevibacillus sp. HD1.4A]
MKSRLSKHLYSTTLVTALFVGSSHLALAAPLAAAVEQTAVAPLSLDHAVEQALKNSVDLELARLDYETTRYESLLTLRDTAAIKKDDVNSLSEASDKYGDEAEAKKDLLVGEASFATKQNALRLDVQKAYFEVRSLEEKIKVQKKSIQRQYWADDNDAKDKLSALESSYKEALAKLNSLLNEKQDKAWLLQTSALTSAPLNTVEEALALAYQKRPDMIEAEAKREYAQIKADFTAEYSAGSTYKGRIARNDLRKEELLLQSLKQKVSLEVSDSYEKAAAAKAALTASNAAKEEAAKQYEQTLYDYANNKKGSLNDLIDKEAELFESETKAADALYQYNLAVSALNQSVGF